MFLIKDDLIKSLNEKDVALFLGQDETTIKHHQDAAIQYVASYIQHRYDFSQVFIDLKEFILTTEYAVGDYIYYNEESWSSTTTYAKDKRVSYQGRIYKSKSSGNLNNLPTDTTKWEYIVDNYEKFTCSKISTNNYPEDTEFWTKGDPRNAMIRNYTATRTIYEHFKKVQPNTIPQWIMDDIGFIDTHLSRIEKGRGTLGLVVRVDEDGDDVGRTTNYGSETKQDFNF